MTFKELLAIVPDQEALAERAAIIQFDGNPGVRYRMQSPTELKAEQDAAEAECVR